MTKGEIIDYLNYTCDVGCDDDSYEVRLNYLIEVLEKDLSAPKGGYVMTKETADKLRDL